MDDQRFDGLTRAIGQTSTRRQALRGLLGLVAGSAAGLLDRDANAARRGYDNPLGSTGDGASVVLFGSPASTAGRCRINATLTTHWGYAYAVLNFTSVDGTFAEQVRTGTDITGNATARTLKSVPQGTVARCGVSVGGWQFGSDDTVITC